MVLRSGDGTSAYSGASSITSPVFAEEINLVNPSAGVYGTVTGRIQMHSPTGYRCGLDNYYWRDGFGQRSADGRFITLLCLNVAYGTAWPGSATTTVKTVARMSADGTVDTSTGATNLIQGACEGVC